MKYTVVQILGVALFVLGGQGAIRLLVDHTDTGLLGWLPGGFAGTLAGHVVAVLVGIAVAAWAGNRAKVHR